MPIGRLIIFLQMLALACADTTGTVAYKSDTCSGYDGGCDITCAKGGYTIYISNSQAVIRPLDPYRNGCSCVEVQATLYGSFLIFDDPSWTARALATGFEVILPGVCTLMYTVSSGEVLGITTDPSGTPPNSEGVLGQDLKLMPLVVGITLVPFFRQVLTLWVHTPAMVWMGR